MDKSQNLTRPFHDWAALRWQMRFVFDSPLPVGHARGAYSRQGEYSAWLIRKGWARVKAGGEEVTVEAGTWLFCFAQSLEQDFSPDAHVLSLRFDFHWPHGELFFEGKPFLLLESTQYPHLETFAKSMLRLSHMPSWVGNRVDPQYAFSWKTHVSWSEYLHHQRCLVDWMEAICLILTDRGWQFQVPGGIESRLAGILNAIDSMPFDTPFSLTRLAPQFGITVKRANLLCVRAYGHSVTSYWEIRRLNHARHLLEQENASVKEVAFSLGFIQLSHFSMWFRRHTGVSPREFTKNPNKRDAGSSN